MTGSGDGHCRSRVGGEKRMQEITSGVIVGKQLQKNENGTESAKEKSLRREVVIQENRRRNVRP